MLKELNCPRSEISTFMKENGRDGFDSTHSIAFPINYA